jgi:hypothetical protein
MKPFDVFLYFISAAAAVFLFVCATVVYNHC